MVLLQNKVTMSRKPIENQCFFFFFFFFSFFVIFNSFSDHNVLFGHVIFTILIPAKRTIPQLCNGA